MDNIGKFILIIGVLLVIAGGLIWLFGDIFGWFGNLPGDIRISRENFQFYFPITSMILLSIFVSFVLWLVRRFFF
jgi:H+/Cl- antiporter ClcA